MDGERQPFTIPIEVRYADIDSLQHVNNARYFSFMEQARAKYFAHLGLWDGRDMRALAVILAQTSCEFRRPIRFGDPVAVQVRTVRLGSKSFDMTYRLVGGDEKLHALGRATLVCFDYDQNKTVSIPEDWRQAIEGREQLGSTGVSQ